MGRDGKSGLTDREKILIPLTLSAGAWFWLALIYTPWIGMQLTTNYIISFGTFNLLLAVWYGFHLSVKKIRRYVKFHYLLWQISRIIRSPLAAKDDTPSR